MGTEELSKKFMIVNTYECKNSKNICWANQSISNIIRWAAGLLGLSFRRLMVQYFNNFCKILLTIILIIFIILYFFITEIYQPFEKLKGQAIDQLFYSQSIK